MKQRREAEVKQLLDKVAPELISLDRDALAAVDVPTMQDKVNTKQSAPEYSGFSVFFKVEERNKKLFVKPSNIEFDPRAKMKGKGGSATRHHIRRTVIEQVSKFTIYIFEILFSFTHCLGLFSVHEKIIIFFRRGKED